jgi:hypothetical protein
MPSIAQRAAEGCAAANCDNRSTEATDDKPQVLLSVFFFAKAKRRASTPEAGQCGTYLQQIVFGWWEFVIAISV